MHSVRIRPKEIAGYKVEKVRDYSNDTILDVATGETSPIGLPNSNVLYYELEGGAWVCVRPSGTEPKIKIYYTTLGKDLAEAEAEKEKLAKALEPMMA